MIAAALFQNGRFTARGFASTCGASWPVRRSGCWRPTLGRLYSSDLLRAARYAHAAALCHRAGDRSPPGWAISAPSRCRIGSASIPSWGVAGLTASAGVAGWVEFTLLRRTLNRRIGRTGLPASLVAQLWTAAALAAAAGWGVKLVVGRHLPVPPGLLPIVAAIPILGAYGLVYFAVTYLFGIEECTRTLKRFW